MRSFGILTFAFGEHYARHAYGLYLSAKAQGVPVIVCTRQYDPARLYLVDHNVPFIVTHHSPDHEPFWYEQFAYDMTPFQFTLKMDADCFIPEGADMKGIQRTIEQRGVV